MAQPNDENRNSDFFVRGFAVGKRIQFVGEHNRFSRTRRDHMGFSGNTGSRSIFCPTTTGPAPPTPEDTSCRWAP